jgi:hypothetical protein
MSSQKIALYESTPAYVSVNFQPFPVATNFTDTVIESFVMDYYNSDGSIVSIAIKEKEGGRRREKEGGRGEGGRKGGEGGRRERGGGREEGGNEGRDVINAFDISVVLLWNRNYFNSFQVCGVRWVTATYDFAYILLSSLPPFSLFLFSPPFFILLFRELYYCFLDYRLAGTLATYSSEFWNFTQGAFNGQSGLTYYFDSCSIAPNSLMLLFLGRLMVLSTMICLVLCNITTRITPTQSTHLLST